MSNNYDLIATVDIDLSTPLVDDTSFGNICIVGPLPKDAPEKAPPTVGVYASLDEVMAAGWDATSATPDPVGKAAMVAFSQSPKPTQIYIAPIQTEIITSEESGEDETVPEAVVDTVQRAVNSSNGWYVLCTAGVDKYDYELIAAYIETVPRMFIYTELDTFENENQSILPAVSDVYYRTAGVYGREYVGQPEEEIFAANPYMNVAWAVKWLYYSSGSETAAFKSLMAVKPSKLSSTELNAIVTNHLNYFVEMGNKNISMHGMVMAGEWCDTIRFRDWLKNNMQLKVVNLFVTTPKVPFTDQGIALVQNQMIAALKEGQDAGGIAPDEFDADGNKIPGFSTSVPLAANIPASDKASRKLTNCRFKARLAGAIHFADLDGSLTYEM